ncbi:hypothetical protein SAMD00019534_099410 [Acytostelium subglobosum LB1]|uniref:hypothetical protein n=1 Tax=Acytostelium subglobosum LB1 TaxID=1410327 RepID=UPI000644E363|nr:hypothetical protein SAMD00019534_099410 [Acytostelium subglobosum LB1]GAM26766.1 hypothetical protein SAMD00019534_099410 [Acytostelium subglobosum LB1]|eukprot:XP_012750427.1 hypothetical protein SAMD00019534_099410 [Acytostelium subglobosum LB1]
MDQLPLIIIGKIVGYLELIVDRMFVTLLYIINNNFILNRRQITIDIQTFAQQGLTPDDLKRQAYLRTLNIDSLRKVNFRYSMGRTSPFSDMKQQEREIKGIIDQFIDQRSDVKVNLSVIRIEPFSLLHLPLTSLSIYDTTVNFDQLPITLTHLKMVGNTLTQPLNINGQLSMSLKILDIKNVHNWNHPITPGSLPSTLEKLLLPNLFNHPITADALPSSLLTLGFGETFHHPLNYTGQLPPSLTILDLSRVREPYIYPLLSLPTSLTTIYLPRLYRGVIYHTPLLHLYAYDWTIIAGTQYPNLKSLSINTYKYGNNDLEPPWTTLFPNMEKLIVKDLMKPLDISTMPMSQLRHCSLLRNVRHE